MADSQRIRMLSQSSSDSSCIDATLPYATVDLESCQGLLGKRSSFSHMGEKSPRRCNSLAVVSLVISVVCLLLVLSGGFVFFLYFYDYTIGSPAVSSNERVCVPCGQISPNPFADSEQPLFGELEVRQDTEGETQTCCASTPAQYAVLFKLILRRQEEVKKLADIFGSGGNNDNQTQDDDVDSRTRKAVAAHLVSKPSFFPYTDNNGHSIQQWKSHLESPLSYTRQGVTFHEHKLYIQDPGVYFVYCQVLLYRAVNDTHPHPKLASHYVKRYSISFPSTSGILLKARHTRNGGEQDRHSSYTGGLFVLNTGDYLFVQVSVPELVSHDDKASFFGLFKIGT